MCPCVLYQIYDHPPNVLLYWFMSHKCQIYIISHTFFTNVIFFPLFTSILYDNNGAPNEHIYVLFDQPSLKKETMNNVGFFSSETTWNKLILLYNEVRTSLTGRDIFSINLKISLSSSDQFPVFPLFSFLSLLLCSSTSVVNHLSLRFAMKQPAACWTFCSWLSALFSQDTTQEKLYLSITQFNKLFWRKSTSWSLNHYHLLFSLVNTLTQQKIYLL